MKKPYYYVKRCLDVIFALALLIPGVLIISVCIIIIKIDSRGSAFFVQTRPGYRGNPIHIYKLRTMVTATHNNQGEPLSDMDRITAPGRIIRKLSIDELPQLFNILKGEMSFIGPRPLLMSYLPLYTKEQMRRHDVLPGISGWAQVNGRNEISWEQKFERDIWYVDHYSFRLDVRILLRTLGAVIKREGINAGVNETMNQFAGTKV